jgi:hypothetical protein
MNDAQRLAELAKQSQATLGENCKIGSWNALRPELERIASAGGRMKQYKNLTRLDVIVLKERGFSVKVYSDGEPFAETVFEVTW